MGNKNATLRVTNNRKYTRKGKKVATIMDFAPGLNLFPMPVRPWKKPYMPKSIGMLRPLLGGSFLTCGRGGGVITIKKTGQ